jgi:hypothetical protein
MMCRRTYANSITLDPDFTHKAAKLPAFGRSNSHTQRLLSGDYIQLKTSLSSGVLVGGAYIALKADTGRICALVPMLVRSCNQLAKGNALRI